MARIVTAAGGKRTHRRDRVVRRFLMLLAAVAVLAFFAPAIVGNTPLRGWALRQAVPAKAGTLSAQSASLGWFSPVELRGVALHDPAGGLVLVADRVHVERTLWSLLGDSSNLGVITIDRPAVFVAARPDGTNIEDLLAAIIPPTPEPAELEAAAETVTPTTATIVVRGGSIAVTDAASGATMVHDPIDATVSLGGPATAVDAAVSLHTLVVPPGQPLPMLPLAAQNQPEGATRAGGQLRLRLTPTDSGLYEAEVQANGVRLNAATPILRRIDPTLQVAGTLGGGGVVRWPAAATFDGPMPAATSEGRLRVTGLRVVAPVLASAPITARVLDVPWRLRTGADGSVAIEQLDATTDFAKAEAKGEFTASDFRRLIAGDWRAARNARVSADVDLALLARTAPQLLSVKQGVAIESGRVRLTASATPAGDGQSPDPRAPDVQSLTAKLETTALVARHAGKQIRWDEPIALDFAAKQSRGQLRIDQLVCRSSFLTGTVRGDLTDFTADAELNLDKLVAQAGQVFDFDQWQLSGRANASARAERLAGGAYRINTSGGIDGCVVSYDGREIVVERKLTFEAQARSALDPRTGHPSSLALRNASIKSGGDMLSVTVQDGDRPEQAWDTLAVSATLNGDVAAWLRRARSVLPAGTIDPAIVASGRVEASATGIVGTSRVQLAPANITLTNVKVDSPDLRIDEREVTFAGDVAWDGDRLALSSKTGTLQSSFVALRANNLVWPAGVAGGELAVRVDLARLSDALPTLLGGRRLEGELIGGVRLRGVGSAEVDLVAKPFVVRENADPNRPPLLSEPKLAVRGLLSRDAGGDRLTFEQLTVQSNDLSGALSGRITEMRTSARVDLAGEIEYDLAKLQPLLASYTGPNISLVGRRRAPIQLRSVDGVPAEASWSRRLTARVEAPWDSASVFGLPVGEGRVVATLGGGQVRTEPIQFTLGEGRASLAPVVQIDPPPMVWGLPDGPLLEDVRISREVSEQMLKFIAPVLADATRVQGTFSLRTDGIHAPVGGPQQIQAAGQLTIRDLQVSPGPSVSEWVSVARTVEALAKDRDPAALTARPAPTLLSIQERAVNFRVENQRVYHSGLEFLVDNVPVSSAGSVGFNETIAITLTVPIQDRWIEGEQRLVGLRGQVLRLPVTGTLDRPKIDRGQLSEFSRQLIRSGLRGAVENELGRALEKLFN